MSARPTPADVRKVFRRHADQFVGASQSTVRATLAIYERGAREILARLATLPEGSLDAVRYQAILGQLREGIRQLWSQVGGALTEQEAAAIELAQRHLAERLSTLAARFGDDPRGVAEVRTRGAAVFRQLFPADAEKLEIVRDGVQQAGTARMDARVRTELAVSLATGEPFFGPQSTFSRLRGVLDGTAIQVECTARTEHSRAYNAAHHAELVGLNEREGWDYRKSVIITQDSRTDDDSIGLWNWLWERGGSIPLDEPFIDGNGRKYIHPPGRPNDREVEVPWRESWGSTDEIGNLLGMSATSAPMPLDKARTRLAAPK